MKKILMIIVLVLAWTLAGVVLVSADGGPHGGFDPTADGCAGCHRAHTAKGAKLLIGDTATLCESCHGSAATGADTDVWDGLYVERDGNAESPAEGVASRGLKGGGVVYAVMNTDLSTGVSAPVTSNHTFDGSSGTAWGNGAIGSGAGATGFTLVCADCHDPHGNGNYRILRPQPKDEGAGPVLVPDEVNKHYTVADATNQYYGENYPNGIAISDWCAQCHTRYMAGAGSSETDSGDAIFTFRHRTDLGNVNCMSCHVAHGTSASMGVESGNVEWPDGSTAPSGDARSSLLRLDNRGVCYQCHETP